MVASRGDWLESVPGPVVLLLALVLAGVMLWFVITRSDARMRDELRDDAAHPVTGRVLAALPVPLVRLLIVVLALGMVAYGISRVV